MAFPTAKFAPYLLLLLLLIAGAHALPGEWQSCSRGTCINTGRYSCTTTTLRGLCPGPASVRCCPSPAGVSSTRCAAANGVCKLQSTCAGSTRTGLCPGPSSIKCCVASSPPFTTPPTTSRFVPDAPDTSGSLGTCVTPVDSLRGHCISRSKCTGGTFNGLCPGSSSILCCVRETRSVARPPISARVSFSQFRSLFTAISRTRARALYPYFLDSLSFARITTCLRVSAFAAQVGHESAGLLYFEELASGAAYEGNRGLGNTRRGDGKRYKGRGPIQLTGRDNYRRAGNALGRSFEDEPESVGMPSGGFAAAAWYWDARVSNADADMGTQEGFDRTTKAINGCRAIRNCNGVSDRRARWRAARRLLGC